MDLIADLPVKVDVQGVLYVLVLVAVLLVIAHRISGRSLGRLPLPPGPKTGWFGVTSLPKVFPWRTYAEWQQRYGMSLSCVFSL